MTNLPGRVLPSPCRTRRLQASSNGEAPSHIWITLPRGLMLCEWRRCDEKWPPGCSIIMFVLQGGHGSVTYQGARLVCCYLWRKRRLDISQRAISKIHARDPCSEAYNFKADRPRVRSSNHEMEISQAGIDSDMSREMRGIAFQLND